MAYQCFQWGMVTNGRCCPQGENRSQLSPKVMTNEASVECGWSWLVKQHHGGNDSFAITASNNVTSRRGTCQEPGFSTRIEISLFPQHYLQFK